MALNSLNNVSSNSNASNKNLIKNSDLGLTSSKLMFRNANTKLLKRLLDDANETGDLILNETNLSEFPSTLAQNYDLSDTIYADLSKNFLTEFPKEICQLYALEKLIIYSNLIRTIPIDLNIYQLKCLKILDLNSNSLSYLPSSLCYLTSLQVLTVNNNKLVSLPEEIGLLKKLIQLDVSCNEITHLPVQIGELISLRALNVRRNLLVELPKEISQLKLVNFDCSSNRINKLPLCFRDMITLIDLIVDHNPLEVPPAHICTKGLLHIMKFLLVENIKQEKKLGILTEYESNSNSQFFSQNNYSNVKIHNASNFNGTNNSLGLSSLMFQSSVKNICKKVSPISAPISLISDAVNSSSSSTSSSSSCGSYVKQKHNPNNSKITSNSISPTSSSSSCISNNSKNNNNKDLRYNFSEDAINLSTNPSFISSIPSISNLHLSKFKETLDQNVKINFSDKIRSYLIKNNDDNEIKFTENLNKSFKSNNSSTKLINTSSNLDTNIIMPNNDYKGIQTVWKLKKENEVSVKTDIVDSYSKQDQHVHKQQNFDINYSINNGLSLYNYSSNCILNNCNNIGNDW